MPRTQWSSIHKIPTQHTAGCSLIIQLGMWDSKAYFCYTEVIPVVSQGADTYINRSDRFPRQRTSQE
jgi:hypothetical protein